MPIIPLRLNARLATKVLQGQSEEIAIPDTRVAGRNIVAPPRNPDLDAIIFVQKLKAMTHGLIAVGSRGGILALVGQVDDGGSEQRPVARELNPGGELYLFTVAQILYSG